MTNRHFTDLSSNNGSFNAAQYASAGHHIVGIKATEGFTYVNPFHKGWVTDAHEHGLAVIHYHFAIPQNGNAAAEAEHFHANIKDFHRPGDYVAFDVEQGSVAQAKGWVPPAYTVMRNGGFHPWLYTFLSFYRQGVSIPSGDYWIAAWGADSPDMRAGDELKAWQYTNGKIGPEPHTFAGVPGAADGDLLNPTLAAQLAKRHSR